MKCREAAPRYITLNSTCQYTATATQVPVTATSRGGRCKPQTREVFCSRAGMESPISWCALATQGATSCSTQR